MGAGPAYYFALPEVARPVGGVNVLLQMADVLASAGYDTRLLYGSAGYTYPFHDCARPSFHDPRLRRTRLRPMRWRDHAKRAGRELRSRLSGQGAPSGRVGASDVIVAPEYTYPEVAALYPDNPRLVVVQDVHGFARAFARDAETGGSAAATCRAFVTTSVACDAAVASVISRPRYRIPLHVGFPGLGFVETKQPQIAYMPRKRPEEARFAKAALNQSAKPERFAYREIDGMRPERVVEILKESLIFLSLSREEGFGLPPAEAMLAGCIVVGYTGVGGNEYFDDETGIVVPESDMVGLVDALRRTIAGYRSDPAPFDAMRRRASERIAACYSRQGFERELLAAWSDIARGLAAGSSPADR